MSQEHQVRQDRPVEHKGDALSPEQDALRIAQLKASHQSHHVAGGCAEGRPTSTADDEGKASSERRDNR